MNETTLLIIDDETDLLVELKPFLERSGFIVHTAKDGERGLEAVATLRPDLIILDVLMPRLNGRDVLRRLRQADDWTPVILLTQIGTPAERAMSLQEGADDYLNKPFDPIELVARVQAILRRIQRGTQPLASYRNLISGNLSLDRHKRQANLDDTPIELTARAFGVLEQLMLHAGEIVPRERLLDEVWGWSYAVETRAVDIRIAEIRKALAEDAGRPRFIETAVGVGYRFINEVQGRA